MVIRKKAASKDIEVDHSSCDEHIQFTLNTYTYALYTLDYIIKCMQDKAHSLHSQHHHTSTTNVEFRDKIGFYAKLYEGTVSNEILFVVCPTNGDFWLVVRMLRIGIIGDWKSWENRLTHVYLKNGH